MTSLVASVCACLVLSTCDELDYRHSIHQMVLGTPSPWELPLRTCQAIFCLAYCSTTWHSIVPRSTWLVAGPWFFPDSVQIVVVLGAFYLPCREASFASKSQFKLSVRLNDARNIALLQGEADAPLMAAARDRVLDWGIYNRYTPIASRGGA